MPRYRIGGDVDAKVWLGYKDSSGSVVFSETYKRLCSPACGLYYEGAVYVFSYLENEMETGVVK